QDGPQDLVTLLLRSRGGRLGRTPLLLRRLVAEVALGRVPVAVGRLPVARRRRGSCVCHCVFTFRRGRPLRVPSEERYGKTESDEIAHQCHFRWLALTSQDERPERFSPSYSAVQARAPPCTSHSGTPGQEGPARRLSVTGIAHPPRTKIELVGRNRFW